MASFRIHEDQENITRDVHRNKLGAPVEAAQKRTVLGLVNNKTDRVTLGKQPLKNAIDTKSFIKGDENSCLQQVPSKPMPAVPVAQFQAFKVYEEPTVDEQIEQQLREKEKKNKRRDEFSSIYKATSEVRFVTKKEAKAILQEKREEQVPSPKSSPIPVASPMSVERSVMDEHDTCSIIAKSRSSKDAFFEMVEYRDEIFNYLLQQEKLHRPKPMYMKKQTDINYGMRTILIDWLVEVTEEYKLHTETLYLAVNYIDRFLSFMSVVRAKLQLVGTAAMYIAAKYEEIYPPDVGEFVYITDDTYTKKQVLRMETLILRILDFDLTIPTAYTFITALCISHKLQERVMYLALYLSELSLLETELCLETLPSTMASAAIALARFYSREAPWTPELEKATGYALNDLVRTMSSLNELNEKAPTMTQQAIQDKYRHTKYMSVSDIKAIPLNLH